jgi:pimeloyl-ACP methyl ester carboxylesterase
MNDTIATSTHRGADGEPRVRHHRADVGGLELHYVEAGEGPLVLLLHGFPDSWSGWRRQIDAFARAGYRVVAPDLRGYGLSDKPARVVDYAIDKLSGDVAALVAALGEESTLVVGHDWGGNVAWDFAMNYPERVRGLVSLNMPHPAKMMRGLTTWPQMKKSWYVFAFQVPDLPERTISRGGFELLRKSLSDAFVAPISSAELDRYIEAMSRPGGLTGPLNYYRAALRGFFDAPKRLRTIDVPVLVVWGERDGYLGAELAEPSPKWVPHARVERIADAGHFVHVDASARVNDLALAYFAERTRTDA